MRSSACCNGWSNTDSCWRTLNDSATPAETGTVIGRLCGAVLGFWLNGKLTFAADDTHVGRHAAMRFLVMWIALTVLNTWIVAHLDDAFGLRMAQLLKPGADLLSGGIGFLLSRHWVYNKY